MATRSGNTSKDPHKDFGKAVELVHKGEYAKARTALQALAKIEDDPRLKARSETYLKICDRVLATAASPDEGTENPYQSGVFAHNRGDYENARTHYKAALKKVKGEESAEILVALAATEAKAGESTAALTYLKKALQTDTSVRFLALGDPDFERLRQTDAFKRLVETAGQ